MTDSPLRGLSFSDIYLGSRDSWLSGVPKTLDPVPAPEECQPELAMLRQLCDQRAAETQKRDFRVELAGTRFRASILPSISETVYVLRRFPASVPDLASLGIHKAIFDKLMTRGLTGLIVIAGPFGSGKTTTASSVVRTRISTYGGVAVTAEDPTEMPLDGRHGEGVCYQTEIDRNEFGEACRNAARWAPSIIFLGEIRDAEAAAEALKASINGRLIICTTHADSPAMAIERLYSLAVGAVGSPEDAASLLSTGLIAVHHQRLEADHHGVKRPKVSFLWLGDGDDSKGVRNTIKNRSFNQIDEQVEYQRNRMMQSGGR